VYVSLSMVRRHGLRKGDAVTGAVRQPREGESRQKFNPLVRIETVNGAEPDTSKSRVEFGKLTPLYPQERLRLSSENEPHNMTARVIDIVAPIVRVNVVSLSLRQKPVRQWCCSGLLTRSLRTTPNVT
jgi:transcription termination factor Rho